MVAIAAYVGMLALQGGFTSLVEFHYLQNRPRGSLYAPRTAMADAIIEGARQAGIGLTMLYGIYETANFGGVPLLPEQRRFRTSPDEALSMMETSLPRQADDLRFGLAPHSLRAVPPDSLAAAAEGLARLDPAAPLHIHAAEQRAEVQACVARLGTTPIDWLLHNAPLGPTWCLIHATHASEAELSGLARSGAVAGLCPSTEANLGDGLFGLPAYVQANGRLGIGTDSHVGLDAFAELRLLEYGQRLRAERRNMLAGTDGHSGRVLWQAASSGGAQAAGRAVGAISPGCRADLVAITPSPETADAGPDFWLDAAIFSSHTQAARDVMVGGAWVVRGGTHVRGDLIAGEYRKKGLLF
jgi:formimidoylglutamate deiminase